MAYWCDGVIELSREEFEAWLHENHDPVGRGPIVYGVPRVNKSNKTIESGLLVIPPARVVGR